MRNKIFLLKGIIVLNLLLLQHTSHAQSFAINTDGSSANASAMLDIKSSNKGLLIPRLTKIEKNAIVSPATGLLIFQSAPDSVGFYYYTGAAWQYLASANTGWSLTGNAGTISSNFLGTLDAQPLRLKINNLQAGYLALNGNIGFGYNALLSNSGDSLIAIGENVLQNNSSGNNNTAVGSFAMRTNTSGSYNAAMGTLALQNNNAGNLNTAAGYAALYSNNSNQNTAYGAYALLTNNAGFGNTAVGIAAMQSTTTGSTNTAIGNSALLNNTIGVGNTAAGAFSGRSNLLGQYNVFLGYEAGYSNDTSYNVFAGYQAGYAVTKGYKNIYVGNEAGRNTTTGSSNTGIGNAVLKANTIGSGLVAIGDSALLVNTGSNNTAIGSKALIKNTSGIQNVAIGSQALNGNITASDNIAIGTQALLNNRAGGRGIAIGTQAMQTITDVSSTFSYNVAIGYRALQGITSGSQHNVVIGSFSGDQAIGASDNVFVGFASGNTLTFGSGNTFLGNGAGSSPTSGSNNTAVGYGSSVTSGNDNSTAIGYAADVIQSNTIVFGNTDVTKWGFGTNPAINNIIEFNAAVTSAKLTVGGTWTNASDKNIKTNITTLDASDVLNRIMQLPITRWSYKKESNQVTHIGPMAQDFYNLFATGQDDKTISTIDPAGVALLGIQQLKKENEELKKELATQRKLIAELMKEKR